MEDVFQICWWEFCFTLINSWSFVRSLVLCPCRNQMSDISLIQLSGPPLLRWQSSDLPCLQAQLCPSPGTDSLTLLYKWPLIPLPRWDFEPVTSTRFQYPVCRMSDQRCDAHTQAILALDWSSLLSCARAWVLFVDFYVFAQQQEPRYLNSSANAWRHSGADQLFTEQNCNWIVYHDSRTTPESIFPAGFCALKK